MELSSQDFASLAEFCASLEALPHFVALANLRCRTPTFWPI